MPVLVALALLAAAPSQEAVTFRTNPPLDRVLEFVVSANAERLDGTTVLAARMVVAQSAKAEGANFRLSRYVSFATAEGTGPMAKTPGEFAALNGRTYPLLVSAGGKVLPLKRGKYENDPGKVPNFTFPFSGPVTVGAEFPLPGGDLQPSGKIMLREVRDLGGQRAAVFAFAGNAKVEMESGSGTMIVSATDGFVLAVDLVGTTAATKQTPAMRVRLTVRRQNVPGLDRLLADLHLED